MTAVAVWARMRRARHMLGSPWAFTGALLVVTLGLVGTLDALHDQSDQRRQAQVIAVELEADAAEQAVAADLLVSSHGGSLGAYAEISEERVDMREKVAELSGLGGDEEVVTGVSAALRSLNAALGAQMRQVRAGDQAVAAVTGERRVDPALEAFDDQVEVAADHFESSAEQFTSISVVGLWLAVIVAGSVIIVLSWRHERVRRRARRALEASRERFRTLTESAFEGVAVVSEGRVTEASEAFTTILGRRSDEAQGLSVVDLVVPAAQELMRRSVSGARQGEFEADGVRGDGSLVRLEIRTRPTQYQGQPVKVVAIRDVTERKSLQDKLEHQALHDALTGLANRTLFTDRLRHALLRHRREQERRVAVLFFDLDDFKIVNDSLGHAAGDRLLTTVAQRMLACLRPDDTVARLGGDEFAVLLEDVSDEAEAVAAADRILEAFKAEPVDLPEGRQAFPIASIGIALATPGSDSTEGVLLDADLAMYEAKAQGKGRYAVFHPGMELRARDRLNLENDLRHATGRGELEVHYQPLVDMSSGRIRSVEALLRWNHPERGAVSPVEFIPVAEQSGLIIPIGRWVLQQACAQISRWQQGNPAAHGLGVSVNVSAHQLNDPDLPAVVAATLRRTGLSAEQLTLEITESALLLDNVTVARALANLRQLGVRLAIDDFGTGYSSLSYLKRLRSDYLKIDKCFVDELTHDPDNQNIVASIISLAGTLGITCVAEGVEDAIQRDHLRRLGCELGQGYYFHRPSRPEVVEMLLVDPHAEGSLAADVA